MEGGESIGVEREESVAHFLILLEDEHGGEVIADQRCEGRGEGEGIGGLELQPFKGWDGGNAVGGAVGGVQRRALHAGGGNEIGCALGVIGAVWGKNFFIPLL